LKKYLSEDGKLIEKSIQKTLSNYKNFTFFNQVDEICNKIIQDYNLNLSIGEINTNIIKYICKELEISRTFYIGSDLNLQLYSKNERILKRAEILGIMTFLHGKGASGYQDNSYLKNNGMKLLEIEYDLTKRNFEEDSSLSIIHHIARLGLKEIKNRISTYKL